MSSTNETLPPVLGLSIEGPPPLGLIDFPLLKGLTVLYGRNGAGKTKVLDALRKALGGQHSADTCWVHLRFGSEDLNQQSEHNIDESLLIFIKQAVEQHLTMSNTYRDEIADMDPKATSVRDLLKVNLLASVADTPSFVKEILDQGYFSLVPTGSGSRKWEVWISALPSDDTPNLQWIVDHQRRQDEVMLDLVNRKDNGTLTNTQKDEALFELLMEQPLRARERGFAIPDLSEQLKNFRYFEREPWVPLPIQYVGQIELITGLVMPLGDDEGKQLAERSLRLARTCKPIVEVVSEDEVEPSQEARTLLLQMSQEADAYLQQVLGNDAPVLQCRLEPWGIAPPLTWEASDHWSSSSIAIDALGSGRSRWAVMAAYLAVSDMILQYDTDDFSGSQFIPYWADRVIIIDEPELGLHRMAERTMFYGLKQWGSYRSLIAATHSAEALRDPSIRLVHVDRDDTGLIVCKAMEPTLQELLQRGRSTLQSKTSKSLGLDPADILQAFRRFIIVEGEHDVAVIETIIGITELAQSRSIILPMRGVKNLMSILGAQLIFDYTTADVLVVLDRTDGPRFEAAWNDARELYEAGKQEAAYASVRSLEGGTKEEQMLSEFCRKALDVNRADRIKVFGLSKPDIIEYLPVGEFLPEADSWESVVRDWNYDGDFKSYLRRRGANISANSLRRIAKGLDHLDDEFVELRRRCLDAHGN